MIAQAAAPAAGGNGMTMIIVYGLFLAGFYFLFIAPQRKKQKEHDKMLTTIQSGDEVLTTGGIFGVITNVKDDRFVVRVSDSTKIEVGKA
jgi:preprotein translocase subunit YajC